MSAFENEKVILLGDSVLFGTGASRRGFGCGRILRNLLQDTPVIIKGRNKDTTSDALQRLSADVLGDTESACVIILFGNNDCRLKEIDKPLISLSEYQENLAAIIAQIRSCGKMPMLSNLQPIDSEMFYKSLPDMKMLMVNINSPKEWHGKYSLACEEVAAHENTRLIDIRSILERYGRDVIASDGLHPNDRGHRIIAETFYETLKGYLKR